MRKLLITCIAIIALLFEVGSCLAQPANKLDKLLKNYATSKYFVIDTLGPYKTPIRLVTFSPSARYVASAGEDNVVIIWVADSNKIYHSLEGHTDKITALSYSSDGKYLASASLDGNVILWDIRKGKQLRSFRSDAALPGQALKPMRCVAFGKDDKELLFGGDDNIITRVRNPLTLPGASTAAKANEPVSCGAFSDDKKLFAFASASLIYVLNTTTGELKVIPGVSDKITYIAISPDDKIVAVRIKNRVVEFWDIKTKTKKNNVRSNTTLSTNNQNDESQIAYCPNGTWMATGSQDQYPGLWDLDEYENKYSLVGHNKAVRSLEFSRDGKMIATGSNDSTIRIWYMMELVSMNTALLDTTTVLKIRADGSRIRVPRKKINDTLPDGSLDSRIAYSQDEIPVTLNERKIKASTPVSVNNKTVTIYVWDDDQLDGDIISLNLNGNWVLDHHKLGKMKYPIKVTLKEGKSNYLLLYAHNEGSTPPNTAGVSIFDGFKETKLILKANLKTCDAVKLLVQ